MVLDIWRCFNWFTLMLFSDNNATSDGQAIWSTKKLKYRAGFYFLKYIINIIWEIYWSAASVLLVHIIIPATSSRGLKAICIFRGYGDKYHTQGRFNPNRSHRSRTGRPWRRRERNRANSVVVDLQAIKRFSRIGFYPVQQTTHSLVIQTTVDNKESIQSTWQKYIPNFASFG